MEQQPNPGYLVSLLQGALVENTDKRLSPEEEVIKRTKKLDALTNALLTLMERNVKVGSRQPTSAPVWVTLEVTCGGFATGRYQAQLQKGDTPNAEFLNPEGIRRLANMLETGCFRINIPEHGAFLVVIWLILQGDLVAAEDLIKILTPWMNTLRFYPDVADTPLEVTSNISIISCETLKESILFYSGVLKNLNVNRIQRLWLQDEAIAYWLPLKQKLLELFLETMPCAHAPQMETLEPPSIKPNWDAIDRRRATSSMPVRRLDREHKHPISVCLMASRRSLNRPAPRFVSITECVERKCGWPCQRFPGGWRERAAALGSEHSNAMLQLYTTEYGLSLMQAQERLKLVMKRRGSVYRLFNFLQTCVDTGPASLTSKQLGILRLILAGNKEKSGTPGSEMFASYWSSRLSTAQTGVRTMISISQQVLLRLAKADPSKGLTSAEVQEVCAPCAEKEVPESITKKVLQAELNSLQELMDKGHVQSGEAMAAVVVKVDAAVNAQSFDSDIAMSRIYYALRVAFDSRRSLLLMNMAKQVRFHELPWVQIVLNAAKKSEALQSSVRQTLELATSLYFKKFPQTIVANKLLQTLGSLAQNAGFAERCPLTEELAVDIFMGKFSDKFVKAAKIGASLLRGSIYAFYYGLVQLYETLHNNADYTADMLVEECKRRADRQHLMWGSAAANGEVIEWQQIITTHNLASLFSTLSLNDSLDCMELAIRTWKWIVETISQMPTTFSTNTLHIRKNVAYAWRQLIFYGSMVEAYGLIEALSTEPTFVALSDDQRTHMFATFLNPLSIAAEGRTPANPVLGWKKTSWRFHPNSENS